MQLRTSSQDGFEKLMELMPNLTVRAVSASVEITPSEEDLKKLITTDFWPVAADPSMIVSDNEAAKNIRASSIVSGMIGVSLSGKRVLDFGCGEGQTTIDMARRGAFTVGYDVQPYDWPNDRPCTFTTDWNKVVSECPYDIVLAYDVFDHMQDGAQVEALKAIHDVMAADGKLMVKFHPWSSIHGTHLYDSLNKAYAHLFFDEEQIKELGGKPQTVTKVTRPLATYRKWLEDAGFVIKKDGERSKSAEVPQFFKDPELAKFLIAKHWQGDSFVKDLATLIQVMCIEFVDYTVMKVPQNILPVSA